jgi:hypothetical protein
MKIYFRNFWPGFRPGSNIFIDMIKIGYEGARVTDDLSKADLVIQSLFGLKPEDMLIPNKITFIGEPILATDDWGTTLGFDQGLKRSNHHYLPLYLLQFKWVHDLADYGNPELLVPTSSLYRKRPYVPLSERALQFTAIINHDPSNNRYDLLRSLLEKNVLVHAFGKPFGNGGFSDELKFRIYQKSTFGLAYESRFLPGYQTEKLIHCYFGGTVPVYWGFQNERVNPHAIIDRNKFDSTDHLVDFLKALVANETEYRKIFDEPLFIKNPTIDDVVTPILGAIKGII